MKLPRKRNNWGASLITIAAVLPACASNSLLAQAEPQQSTAQDIVPAESTPGQPSVKPATRDSRFSRPAEREIQFQEGVMQYSRGQLRQAETNFRAVITDDPADAEAYYYLGLSQLDQNKSKEAAESFNQSLRLDPTSDEVRAARASALIRLRRFDDAEQDIKVLEADPRWSGLVHYLRGHLYYSQGKLDNAAREFKAAERSGQTEANAARLYSGLTYLRMKDLAQARRSFRDAGGDAAITSAAQQLDTTLARAEAAQRRLDARLSLGYEWDSNVIQTGTDTQLPFGITNESDGSIVAQPRLGYALIRKGNLEAGLEGSGYFSWHNELTDFDISSYQGGPYLDYKTSKETRIGIRYGYNYLEFGHEPFLARHIVTPTFLWFRPNVAYTQVYYQYQLIEYDEPALLAPFERDGDLHRVGLLQGFYLPALFKDADRSIIELSYRFEHQDTEGSDFDGNFHTAGFAYYVPLPWWNLKADVGAGISYEGYSNPNSIENNPLLIEDADDKRVDWEFRVSTGITKKFNEWLSVRVDYTYTDNNSNIETLTGSLPYEYDRHVVGARLILSY